MLTSSSRSSVTGPWPVSSLCAPCRLSSPPRHRLITCAEHGAAANPSGCIGVLSCCPLRRAHSFRSWLECRSRATAATTFTSIRPMSTANRHGRAARQPVDLDGVKIHYFRVPALRRLWWAPGLDARLRESIHDFDVVHVHGVFLLPMFAAARAAARAAFRMSLRGEC